MSSAKVRVGPRSWVRSSGVGAAFGAVLWVSMPWLQLATVGTRPYVATVFDVGECAGWLLLAGGLVGVRARFGDRFGRSGRAGLWLSGVGMSLVGVVLLRSVAVYVGAGFRAVPSTGADPAGLLLTWGLLLGFGLAVGGTGLLGVGLHRLDRETPLTTGLLLAAPLFPTLLVGARLLGVLPLSVGVVLVRTNVALVPFAVGWLALARLVLVGGDEGDGSWS